MITFNTKEEATQFQTWVNENSPMLPILPNEPIEQDNVWIFELSENITEELVQEYYNKYINQ